MKLSVFLYKVDLGLSIFKKLEASHYSFAYVFQLRDLVFFFLNSEFKFYESLSEFYVFGSPCKIYK